MCHVVWGYRVKIEGSIVIAIKIGDELIPLFRLEK